MVTFVSKEPRAVVLEKGRGARVESKSALPAGTPVDLADPGHDIEISWPGVAGTNEVEVDSAVLELTQDAIEETLPDLPLSGSTVTIPADKRVASLKLKGLTGPAKETLEHVSDLGTRRLVVALSTAGEPIASPLYAVPEVPKRGVFPATFTGAGFGNSVLTLPSVAARKVKVSLVDNFPDSGKEEEIKITAVEGRLVTFPSRLALIDEEGTTVWARPNEMAAGESTKVDVRNAVENVLKKKVKSGASLKTKLRLTGTGRVRLSFSGARGAVVRNVEGVVTAEPEGDAMTLPIPPPALPRVMPSRVISDVTVRYKGIRILETVSDPVPAQAGGVGGVVVAETAVLRVLPSHALDGFVVARIGIVGRAAVDCELAVELVDVTSGAPAAKLTAPAARVLNASIGLATVWLDVPKHDPIALPAAVSVRANHGRFFWAAAPEPLLRVAVFDPDPGGRAVRIGGQDVLLVTAPKDVHAPATTLNAAAFQTASPLVESALFATVDLSDLRLEYDR